MDEIDQQIIEELAVDARKPFKHIAKKIGVSISTITKRYNDMKEKGIIVSCSTRIDLRKIGYRGMAYILITHSPNSNLSEAMGDLKKITNVIVCSKAIGDYEGYAILAFKDTEDLYQKILQIKKLPQISNVEVSFTVDSIQFFPLSALGPKQSNKLTKKSPPVRKDTN